jgi:DUF1680 family protein
MFELKGKAVTLNEGDLLRREKANYNYMMKLDKNSLLLNYNLEAGRSCETEHMHGGWESPTCQLRGHFLGHWLSAAAMHYYASGDMEIKAKADAIVKELEACQIDNGGQWVSSIPEKYLYWIAKGKSIWAPHYTIHKIFMGLLDMYQYAQNQLALQIAINFSLWFYDWSGKFTREEFDDILDYETGGMLEIWVQLYEITRKEMYLTLMERYYRGRLFDGLLEGRDMLTNMHANTTIPEVIGCARAYDVTGDQKWRAIAEAYWKCAVTDRGTFVTGGQTCGEIWTPKNEFSSRLGERGQEHCTVYNMIRLADYLFRWTGDSSYADYIERNLYNGIMAQGYWKYRYDHGFKSDYPDHGLLTYVLPLKAGSRKGWSSETEDFFCCHGTLVQANAAFNRYIYYQNEDTLYVNQFFDSAVSFSIAGKPITITQKRDTLSGSFHNSSSSSGLQSINANTSRYAHNPDCLVEQFKISVSEPVKMTLKLRVPFWLKGKPECSVNQETVSSYEIQSGYLTLNREWQDKDELWISYPMGIEAVALPDDKNMVAFTYGPMVLAGICSEERMLYVESNPAELLIHDNEREWSNWKPTFRTKGQDRGIFFKPIADIGYEQYEIYFPIKYV